MIPHFSLCSDTEGWFAFFGITGDASEPYLEFADIQFVKPSYHRQLVRATHLTQKNNDDLFHSFYPSIVLVPMIKS